MGCSDQEADRFLDELEGVWAGWTRGEAWSVPPIDDEHVQHEFAEHDVVTFRDAVGAWPAGTIGAVVSDYGDVKLVEVADEKGVALDYIQVPAPLLDCPKYAQGSGRLRRHERHGEAEAGLLAEGGDAAATEWTLTATGTGGDQGEKTC